jgi:uncharacterized membrane protein
MELFSLKGGLIMWKKLSVFLLVSIMSFNLIGCVNNNDTSSQPDSNKDVVKEDVSNQTENVTDKEDSNTSDLLYREYNIGANMASGTVFISKEHINESSENPEAIVVFYNDEILESTPYEQEDLTFNLDKSGWYGFFVLDGKEMVDISGMVSELKSADDSIVTPLD